MGELSGANPETIVDTHGSRPWAALTVVCGQILSIAVERALLKPGRPNALKPQTVEDLKHCFMLITSREKEIIEDAGGSNMDKRPRYADEPA